MLDSWSLVLTAPGPAAARRGVGRRTVLAKGTCWRRRPGRAGGHQLVRRIDHDRTVGPHTDLAAEPDPAPAVQSGDVRAPVEQRGQVAGRVRDLRREHGVALE